MCVARKINKDGNSNESEILRMSRVIEMQVKKISSEIKGEIDRMSESTIAIGYECAKADILEFVDKLIANGSTMIPVNELCTFLYSRNSRTIAKEVVQNILNK
jgi:hypothetical protein